MALFLRRRAATARRLVQRNAPSFDRHAAKRSKCNQRRSRLLATVLVDAVAIQEVLLALQRQTHIICEGSYAGVDTQILQDRRASSHRSRNVHAERPSGRTYKPEIQKMTPHEHFTIDRTLKASHGADGKTAYYVSWLGYPSKFDT